MSKPLTQQFKDLYARGHMWPKWLRFLWLGLVVWFEEKYLDALTEQRVTEAISEWREQEEKLHPSPQPIITESPSEVPGLPEMRIRAPWVEP